MKGKGTFDPVPASESAHGPPHYVEIESPDSDLPVNESTKEHLVRTLTFWDGVAIIVGIVIGSGIFSSPGLALYRSGSPGACLLAWAASGCLVALTSQCYFELGAMMPTAGGDFDYLDRAYGPQAAFSFAWFNFFISKTGSQAITAIVFGSYVETVLFNGGGLSLRQRDQSVITKLLAAASIIALFLLNCLGIRESTLVQNILTILKLLLVVILFIVAMVYVSFSPSTIIENLSVSNSFHGSSDAAGFFSAMIACLWCFDGWADLNFLMEEILGEPAKQLPRIVLSSLAIITTAYLLANVSYFAVLDKSTLIHSHSIAVDVGQRVGRNSHFGYQGAVALSIIFALGVAISTAGSNNGSIMTGGRAFFAVARSGRAPRFLSRLNKAGSPWAALLAQCVWSLVLLALPGSSFATLLDYFGPTSWVYYALTSSAVIVLRVREPHAHRPYRIPLYPLPPLLVVAIAIVIVGSSLMREPLFCSLALGFVALSIPFYYIYEKYCPDVAEATTPQGSPP